MNDIKRIQFLEEFRKLTDKYNLRVNVVKNMFSKKMCFSVVDMKDALGDEECVKDQENNL